MHPVNHGLRHVQCTAPCRGGIQEVDGPPAVRSRPQHHPGSGIHLCSRMGSGRCRVGHMHRHVVIHGLRHLLVLHPQGYLCPHPPARIPFQPFPGCRHPEGRHTRIHGDDRHVHHCTGHEPDNIDRRSGRWHSHLLHRVEGVGHAHDPRDGIRFLHRAYMCGRIRCWEDGQVS